jgi:hypothetical protein
MTNPNSILIWQGNIHLYGKPGIYGNTNYTWLFLGYPVNISNIDNQNLLDALWKSLPVRSIFSLLTPGHGTVVKSYEPDPVPENSYQFRKAILKDNNFFLYKANNASIGKPIHGINGTTYISMAIQIETGIKSGLYDDFIISGLNNSLVSRLPLRQIEL